MEFPVEHPEVPEERPEDRKQAAVDAKRFADDPTTHRILAMVTSYYLKELLASSPADAELREHCYRQMLAIQEFNHQLKKLASNGILEIKRRNARNGSGIS